MVVVCPPPAFLGAAGCNCPIGSESLPIMIWQERQDSKGSRHMHTHPGDHASCITSHSHIQVLGSTCPPAPPPPKHIWGWGSQSGWHISVTSFPFSLGFHPGLSLFTFLPFPRSPTSSLCEGFLLAGCTGVA